MTPFLVFERNECYDGHLGPVLLIYWRLYSVLVAQATPVIVDAGVKRVDPPCKPEKRRLAFLLFTLTPPALCSILDLI